VHNDNAQPSHTAGRAVEPDTESAAHGATDSAGALRRSFYYSGMSLVQLWAFYISMGGELDENQLHAALLGQLRLDPHNHNMIAQHSTTISSSVVRSTAPPTTTNSTHPSNRTRLTPTSSPTRRPGPRRSQRSTSVAWISHLAASR
jgi:hypothetical protein